MLRTKRRAIRVFLAFLACLALEALLMVAEVEWGDTAYIGAAVMWMLLLSAGPWRLFLRGKWRRWYTDDYPPS